MEPFENAYNILKQAYDAQQEKLGDLREELARVKAQRDTVRATKMDLERRLAHVVKERDCARGWVGKLQAERDVHDADMEELEEIKAAWDKTARALNEETLGRKRDAEDFMRRVRQQEHYFNAKIQGIFHNRDQIAESLRKAESERNKYRVMYASTKDRTSISLGVENGRLRKKNNQLQQQKRKWKRLHAEAEVRLTAMTRSRDFHAGVPESVKPSVEERLDALERRVDDLED